VELVKHEHGLGEVLSHGAPIGRRHVASDGLDLVARSLPEALYHPDYLIGV
jgi:hypothetical protein